MIWVNYFEYDVASAQWEILLWENPDENISGSPATSKRENVAVWRQHSKLKGNMTDRQMMS